MVRVVQQRRLRPSLDHGILEIDNSEPLSAIGPRSRQ